MYGVAILKRRLRPGKTYEDFRKAWFHETGFATANRMLTMQTARVRAGHGASPNDAADEGWYQAQG